MLRFCSPYKLLHICSSKSTNIHLYYNRICSFHCSTVRLDSQDWQNFEKQQVNTTLYIKKNPEKMIDIEDTELLEKTLKNSTNLLVSLPKYTNQVIELYKTWREKKRFKNIIEHFETKLLVISPMLLSQCLDAFLSCCQYKKGVEMYEKYSPLFPTAYPSVAPVICYYKAGKEDKALEEFAKIQHLMTTVHLSILIHFRPPLSIIERIVDNPSFHHFLNQNRDAFMNNTKNAPKLNAKIRRLLNSLNTQDVSSSIHYYSVLRTSYDNLLQQYMNDSSSVTSNQLFSILKKLLIDDAQNFIHIIPSYISKSQQVLSTSHFCEVLFGVCSMSLRNGLSRESVDLFCQFCDKSQLEIQQRFFTAYYTMLIGKTSFYEIKQLLMVLQPFIDKFDILNQHHSGTLVHKHLAFYYIVNREYGKAKEEMRDIVYSSFSELLEYFYKWKQYEAVIFIYENVSPRFIQREGFHPLHSTRYIQALINTKRCKDVIDYWMKWKQEISIEMPILPKMVVLLATVYQNDMQLFGTILEELKQVEPARINKGTTERIVSELKKKNYDEWMVKFYNEVVTKHAVSSSPLSESTMQLIKEAQLEVAGTSRLENT